MIKSGPVSNPGFILISSLHPVKPTIGSPPYSQPWPATTTSTLSVATRAAPRKTKQPGETTCGGSWFGHAQRMRQRNPGLLRGSCWSMIDSFISMDGEWWTMFGQWWIRGWWNDVWFMIDERLAHGMFDERFERIVQLLVIAGQMILGWLIVYGGENSNNHNKVHSTKLNNQQSPPANGCENSPVVSACWEPVLRHQHCTPRVDKWPMEDEHVILLETYIVPGGKSDD